MKVEKSGHPYDVLDLIFSKCLWSNLFATEDKIELVKSDTAYGSLVLAYF